MGGIEIPAENVALVENNIPPENVAPGLHIVPLIIRQFYIDIANGNIRAVIDCIDANPDILTLTNGLNGSGYPPLIAAARSGRLDIVNLFLSRRPESLFQAYKSNGSLAIHFAAQEGHQEVFWRLINATPNVLQYLLVSNREGQMSVFFAAGRGHLMLLESIFDRLDQLSAMTPKVLLHAIIGAINGKNAKIFDALLTIGDRRYGTEWLIPFLFEYNVGTPETIKRKNLLMYALDNPEPNILSSLMHLYLKADIDPFHRGRIYNYVASMMHTVAKRDVQFIRQVAEFMNSICGPGTFVDRLNLFSVNYTPVHMAITEPIAVQEFLIGMGGKLLPPRTPIGAQAVDLATGDTKRFLCAIDGVLIPEITISEEERLEMRKRTYFSLSLTYRLTMFI